MNWILWLKGLAAVAIGGAATGAAAVLSTGQLNKNAAITAGIGALSTVLAYLVKSPLVPRSASQPAEAQNGIALPSAGISNPA
jgi:hypothetical protein